MRIVCTADGSLTLESSHGECYHSTNGALQESLHVFIDAGFSAVLNETANILEVGFGTGLNALLTLLEAEKRGSKVYYEAVERYPICLDIATQLNYCNALNVDCEKYFMSLHTCEWNKDLAITNSFVLKKCELDLLSFIPSRSDFDLVYFDAFSPDTQPELWTEAVFSTIYKHMKAGGVLVTYSSKGLVKECLRNVGFSLERLAGANGKRHMLRATKL